MNAAGLKMALATNWATFLVVLALAQRLEMGEQITLGDLAYILRSTTADMDTSADLDRMVVDQLNRYAAVLEDPYAAHRPRWPIREVIEGGANDDDPVDDGK